MKFKILTIVLLLTFNCTSYSQCLTFNSYTMLVQNNNGTCTYNVSVTVNSGNGAQGTATFSIGGNVVYTMTNCVCNPTTVTFPITVTCGTSIIIDLFYDAPGIGNDCSGTSGQIVLPVNWYKVTLKEAKGKNTIFWSTTHEVNNDYFTIERSGDAKIWNRISDAIASAHNSNSIQSYEFTDDDPEHGSNFYRIKQTDYDGNSSFSDVLYQFNKTGEESLIFPNPFHDHLTLSMKDISSWQIFNTQGLLILTGTSEIINTSALESGIYMLRAESKNEIFTRRIVKF